MAHFPTPILVVSLGGPAGAVQHLRRAGGRRGRRAGEAARRRRRRARGARGCARRSRLVSRIRVIPASARPADRAAAGRGAAAGRCVPARRADAARGRGRRVHRRPGRARPSCCARCRRTSALPVLCVQHIAASEPFALAFTDWLAGQTRRAVRVRPRRRARCRRSPAGSCWPRRTGTCAVRGGAAAADDGPPRHSCRPSVDVLFESVAAEYGPARGGLPAHRHGPRRRRRGCCAMRGAGRGHVRPGRGELRGVRDAAGGGDAGRRRAGAAPGVHRGPGRRPHPGGEGSR